MEGLGVHWNHFQMTIGEQLGVKDSKNSTNVISVTPITVMLSNVIHLGQICTLSIMLWHTMVYFRFLAKGSIVGPCIRFCVKSLLAHEIIIIKAISILIMQY